MCILVSYKPLAIKVPTSAVDAVRRCCAATRVSTRLRSAAATAEHSYTSLRGRRAPLRHRALEQIYKLTSSRLASLARSHHQSMTQGPSPPQGQRATGWWSMPFSLETCAWAVSALFQFLAGSIPRVPRNYPYPQNFGTFGDTTPGNVSEAPFTGPFDLVMAW